MVRARRPFAAAAQTTILAATLLSAPALAGAKAGKAVITADPLAALPTEIPYTRIVLKNGLTLIVHEDHSSPLVATNIWYHVGSKNEPRGRTGFAHLFEHLLFNGSENFNDDFFKATQKFGATRQNGTTSWDRTNYFQVVPKNALDSMLWLESDRMGHLLGAIDQARLDEQRAVVKNEKRQGENQPYAKADDIIIQALTPTDHPYGHNIIGSMEDLDAASLQDVRTWFKDYYGPSNAVLVLSGDITPAEALAKAETYFGDIDPGRPVALPKSSIIRRTGTTRATMTDRVSQARLMRTWNISDYAAPDTTYLEILAELLAGDRNSRLVKRLVIEERLASGVSAWVDDREIGGLFQIDVLLSPGADIARVEAIVDQELKRMLAQGPAASEVQRVRTRFIADEVRTLASISGKGSLLVQSQTYLGDPGGWKARSRRYREATPGMIQSAAKTWLSDGDFVLTVLPFGDLKAAPPIARHTMPEPGAFTPATFPAAERTTLANGLKLVVARRTGAPLVTASMLFSTGYAKDYKSIAPGTGGLAMDLLTEGTSTMSGAQLTDAFSALGATISTSGGGETSTISLAALTPTLPQALSLFADVVQHPSFPQSDLDRVRAQTSAAIDSGRQNPNRIASRLMPHLAYGPDSPYGRLVTEATLQSIDRKDLLNFHRQWFHPNNATLVVVGDTSLAKIRPMIEKAFASWTAGPALETLKPLAQPFAEPAIYLIDRPATPQSVIQAVMVAPPRSDGDDIAREVLNTSFGGVFVSRLNMKLREEKGWSYGARSRFSGGRGSRLFSAGGSVQTDNTVESMAETAKLLSALAGSEPITPIELADAQAYMTYSLVSEWSTNNGVASYLSDQVVDGLPDDFYAHYGEAVSRKDLAAINQAARNLGTSKPIWVVVGDRSRIEADLRASGLGEVHVIDADGKPLAK